jgi:hypothetical protein
MEPLYQILSEFEIITLDEMDSVGLMDRTDTKFVFKLDQLPFFLKNIINDYRILDIKGVRASKYETLYFDTEDFRLYMEHHKGKPNRYKIRSRKYVDSNLHFFEIKFKNNKGRTIKGRIKLPEIEQAIHGKSEEFLNSRTNIPANILLPKLWTNCSRITLVNKYSKERLTLDIGLNFKNDQHIKHLPNLVIAEVKQEKATYSPFIKLMRQKGIKEGSISKYCFGVIFLYDQIKRNNFKPNLLTINKIMYDLKT